MISPFKALILSVTIHLLPQALAVTQFNSHVSVSTPARSFTHGVGDPVSVVNSQPGFMANFRRPSITRGSGYPRIRPSIPFINEDVSGGGSRRENTHQYSGFREIAIPLLPISPYKVDSPDPESLWPEGLFLPPMPPRIAFGRRSDSETELFDPYLLEGSEAVAAVQRSTQHGQLYFHEIPHINSLFANQEQRVQNNLKPHVIGSIRHTWPYNRT